MEETVFTVVLKFCTVELFAEGLETLQKWGNVDLLHF